MTLDTVILAGIYLLSAYVLFWLGKLVFDFLHRDFRIHEELVERKNSALALALVGYYLGVVFAIGGAIVGPSSGLADDVLDLFLYGLLAIILLNISTLVSDRLILYQFSNTKEIIQDQNTGTGIIAGSVYTATGLILFGAISGEGGTVWTAIGFWGLGQLALILTGLVYEWITPYSIHDEIEQDNVAVGVSFAGALLGMGNILRYAVSGDFYAWQDNLLTFWSLAAVGLVALPIIRWATDKVLLPGTTITAELVEHEQPNLGAAYIEMFSYIGASFLITWCL